MAWNVACGSRRPSHATSAESSTNWLPGSHTFMLHLRVTELGWCLKEKRAVGTLANRFQLGHFKKEIDRLTSQKCLLYKEASA